MNQRLWEVWQTIRGDADRVESEEIEKEQTTIEELIMPKEIDRYGSFIAYDSGVLLDTKTSFEWIAGPNKDTNWDEAKSWVENLTIDGGGWRIPTIKELKIIRNGGGTAAMFAMDSVFDVSDYWLWSCEADNSSLAFIFDLISDYGLWVNRNNSDNNRVLAVRSRKKTK